VPDGSIVHARNGVVAPGGLRGADVEIDRIDIGHDQTVLVQAMQGGVAFVRRRAGRFSLVQRIFYRVGFAVPNQQYVGHLVAGHGAGGFGGHGDIAGNAEPLVADGNVHLGGGPVHAASVGVVTDGDFGRLIGVGDEQAVRDIRAGL